MANEISVPPADEFNRALVANVHPPDWTNPQPADRYNLVVIGAGTAGLVTAAGAAGLGGAGLAAARAALRAASACSCRNFAPSGSITSRM